LVVRGRKLPKDGRLALAHHAAKDSPSPGGAGRGEGGRGNKINAARREQLDSFKAAQEFSGEQGHN